MSNDDFELVRGSGNIFRDSDRGNADLKQLRAIVAAQMIGVLDGRKLSTPKAEALTSTPAADFSRIRNSGIGRLTVGRLIGRTAHEAEGSAVRGARQNDTHDRERSLDTLPEGSRGPVVNGAPAKCTMGVGFYLLLDLEELRLRCVQHRRVRLGRIVGWRVSASTRTDLYQTHSSSLCMSVSQVAKID